MSVLVMICVVWSEPVNLSQSDAISYLPTIVCKNNMVAVAWTERHEFNRDWDIYYIQSNDGGEHWCNIQMICGEDASICTEPAIAIDSTGSIHVVWLKDYDDIFWTYLCGDTWATPVDISNQPGDEGYPVIIVDKQNRVWCFWTLFSGNHQCYYAIYDGSSWSEPVSFTDQLNGACCRPQVDIDTAGNLHVIWLYNEDITHTYVYYKKYDSMEWSDAERIPCIENVDDPVLRIKVDKKCRPWVIWRNNYRFYYTYKDTGGWYGPFSITDEPGALADCVFDSEGRLHLIWIRVIMSRFEYLYHSTLLNTGWTTPEQLSESPSIFPAIAIDDMNNLHVVWSQGPAVNGGGDQSDLYYRKGTNVGVKEKLAQFTEYRDWLILGTSNPSLQFKLIKPAHVTVSIFELTGQTIKKFNLGYKASGTIHTFTIPPDMLTQSGIYFYQIATPHETVAKGKLIVIR